jgi:DNA-binding NarL/FixJ family response regulator
MNPSPVWHLHNGAGLRRDAASYPRPRSGERVLVVDDCTLYRDALATNLTGHGVGAVAVAWDLPSVLAGLDSGTATVILVNTAMRDLAVILRTTARLAPGIPVIAMAATDGDEAAVIACAEAGVAGYHLRSHTIGDLLRLIDDVVVGRTSYPPQISAMLLRRVSEVASQRQSPRRDPVLTARETQILGMLELGHSNQDIAAQLSIAVHTVKNHVHSLLTKLGVGSRAEAAALAHARRTGTADHDGTRSRTSQNWLR